MDKYNVIIIGIGLSGCVMAERFANYKKEYKILMIDKRDHIGGNCFDYYDKETNILINKYGAHIFHTNNERVWEYINLYSKWERYDHQVKCIVENKIIPIPINIITVNSLLNINIKNENEMNEWIDRNKISYKKITNGEEMVKSRVGNLLYEKIFKEYTFKQWNKYPNELIPEVLARIPIYNDYDCRYFKDKYQVLPKKGYTYFMKKLIDYSCIDVLLNTDFNDIKGQIKNDQIIIYTGPIDLYFNNEYEKLEYRSINFEIERYFNCNYYQCNSVINYPENNVQFTRIVEYKHFMNQKSPHTIIVKEYSCDEGEPFYPVLTNKNIEIYKKYQLLINNEKNVHFLGRLANYKYFNMDEAILNALEYFDSHFS